MAVGHSVVLELSVCFTRLDSFFFWEKIVSEVEYDFLVIAAQTIFGGI